jgi:hypothetical protein
MTKVASRKFQESVQIPTELPRVDFGKYVVIGAFLGPRNVCGSEISVVDARDLGREVLVAVKTTIPKGCPVDAAISYPFAFARLARVDKPYRFSESTEFRTCPPPP